MRLAWFTPWPPVLHAAGRRSRDVIARLRQDGSDVDLFVDDRAAADDAAFAAPASTFASRSSARPYDLTVVQVISGQADGELLHAAGELPGLAVLDDFAWHDPNVRQEARDLTAAGFDGAYSALWPLPNPAAHARLTAVPSAARARMLLEDWPGAPVVTIAPGIAEVALDKAAARAELGLATSSLVFGTTSRSTARAGDEARLGLIASVFAGIAGRVPDVRLLVVGDADPLASTPDVSGGVAFAGPLTEDGLLRAVAAADVWISLRWPDAGGPPDDWLAALAAGRPTVTFDVASLAGIPRLDPQSWRSWTREPPVGVALDVLDARHSLRLALYRLAIDAPLRGRLGDAARDYWRARHTVAHMTADYVQAIQRAVNEPAPTRPARSTARQEAPARRV